MADSIAATVDRIKRDPSNVLDRVCQYFPRGG